MAPGRLIEPFHVMEVMRAAEEREARGGDVLHLEVGQPSTPAPAGVRAAAHRALDADALAYTTALGHQPLRERIARHYEEWYGVAVPLDRVAVTVGASGGFVLAFLAAFAPGDRVAVAVPGYPCYRNILAAFGVEVVAVPVDASTRFQLTPALLEPLGALAGVVVGSPSNPTGTMVSAEELAQLVAWCRRSGTRLVSDEIYHGLTYGEEAPTAAGDDQALVLNSFSKYFSMTGWRVGWMVVPDGLATAVERLGQNLFIAAPTLSQVAAVAAFDCHEELAGHVARYERNRAVLLDALPAMGLDRLAPADGAFYVYAEVDHLTGDSQQLCARWLEELGVAVTPGIDFDPARGASAVRFSFAGAEATVVEAVRRLEGWCRRHR